MQLLLNQASIIQISITWQFLQFEEIFQYWSSVDIEKLKMLSGLIVLEKLYFFKNLYNHLREASANLKKIHTINFFPQITDVKAGKK